MMLKLMLKWSLTGLILAMIVPLLLIGLVLTTFVAVLLGAPLTAPAPPVLRSKPRPSPPRVPDLRVTRSVVTAA